MHAVVPILLLVLAVSAPGTADAQSSELLRASRVTFAVDGHASAEVAEDPAAEHAHHRELPQFILCIPHPVGRGAGGALYGGATGAAVGWVTFTFGFGLLASDHGTEYRRVRRNFVAAGAAVGAVIGAYRAVTGPAECEVPPPSEFWFEHPQVARKFSVSATSH